MKSVIVIPARYGATRFPGKSLARIGGRPMIQWVWEAASKSRLTEQVVVATDDDRIADVAAKFGADVVMTKKSHRSGTDRMAEVADKISAQLYVNVQGDEPLTRPEHIAKLIEVMRPSEVEVGTLKTPASDTDIANPGAVKVVTDAAGRALYFSRATIPFDRDGAHPRYYKHLGIYGHRKDALDKFVRWPESLLERSERLEQLRFLENGVPIYVAETPFDTVGVGMEDDVRRVEEILRKGNAGH